MFKNLEAEVRVVLCCFLILAVALNVFLMMDIRAQEGTINILNNQSGQQGQTYQNLLQQLDRCHTIGEVDVLLRSLGAERPDRDKVVEKLVDFVKEQEKKEAEE